MIIKVNGKDKETSFKPENMIDSYRIGILKERLSKKGIPVKMTIDLTNKKTVENFIIPNDDLLDLLTW